MSYGMAGLVGVPLKVRVSPTGDAVVLDGMDAIYNNMADLSGFTDAAERDTFRTMMAEEFAAEELATDLVALPYIYESRPVAPGSTWAVSSVSETVLPIQLTGTARLDSSTLDTSFVSLDAQVKAIPDTSEGLFPNRFQNPEMSGTTTGTVKIDPETGIPLQFDLDQTLMGTAEMQTDQQTLDVDLSVRTTSATKGSISRTTANDQ
jgi:hypothetical protein